MSAAPDGVQVALTFDFDVVSNWIGSLGATSPGPISRGEFGRIGVRRVLGLLDEFDARATFFTPGHTAASWPKLLGRVVEAGHEVAHHGWVHENPTGLSADEERRVLERGIVELERVVGTRPVGYRSPAWDNSPHTTDLLLELGFEYDSSLMGGDYEPYWCRTGDRYSPTEPFVLGTPVPLVEMPVAWHLDDFPYFEFIYAPVSFPGLQPPSTVLEIWKGEFDYLYNRVGSGVLIVTMHPQVIGRGHRQEMLRAFLEHVVAHDGVSFTTCVDYVRAWREGRQPSLPPDLE
jgi:peptidoglycan/xylan/chitin deacetylase (PgdA/CDA1 family)